jgi:hypothetical protein
MSEWEIEPLDQRHDRISFDCGNPMLNEWLVRHEAPDC